VLGRASWIVGAFAQLSLRMAIETIMWLYFLEENDMNNATERKIF